DERKNATAHKLIATHSAQRASAGAGAGAGDDDAGGGDGFLAECHHTIPSADTQIAASTTGKCGPMWDAIARIASVVIDGTVMPSASAIPARRTGAWMNRPRTSHADAIGRT